MQGTFDQSKVQFSKGTSEAEQKRLLDSRMDLDPRSLDYVSKAFKVDPLIFTPIPTRLSYTEYAYDSGTMEFKVHIWTLPQVDLRKYWQELAESFGHEALKYTHDVPLYWPPQNITIKDSVFLGMKSTTAQAQNILARLLDIDRFVFESQMRNKTTTSFDRERV